VVVTSRHTVGDVAALGVAVERIDVVEPGTDPVEADGSAEPQGRPLQLLCVASLTPRKGHALLLEALAALTDRDWQLHLVGSTVRDPVTAAALRAAAERPALRGRVVWHGELAPDALALRLAAAHVFVLPSLHEGYGMAAAEALAHGLPLVATTAGALADTVPDAAALKVPPGEVAPLRDALARLIDDPALRARLAAGARDAGRRLPDWTAQSARFSAVLERVG
jgi:glycosyltransferase involved in cell wall biosynthesis